jgi:hypothetical protein
MFLDTVDNLIMSILTSGGWILGCLAQGAKFRDGLKKVFVFGAVFRSHGTDSHGHLRPSLSGGPLAL